MTIIQEREANRLVAEEGLRLGFSALQADIISRRLSSALEVEAVVRPMLANIPHPSLLADCDRGAARIVQACKDGEHIGLVTDYDVDGLTSQAIMVHGFLDFFGHDPELLSCFVGHRHKDGYGLSEQLTERIIGQKNRPSLIITADCGSSDEPRLAQLADLGIEVVVTDHHLLSENNLPISAYAHINPQRLDCDYPDKSLAGCLVCWLLMSRVRTMLVEEGRLSPKSPKLGSLLDYVALGTVADSMSLQSPVNRAVVAAGLRGCQSGGRPCWGAASSMLGKSRGELGCQDFAFQIGPRVNAASRMAEPERAAKFLLAADRAQAKEALARLENLNRERKEVEQQAMEICARWVGELAEVPAIIVISHPSFHPGILGIIASRLVEQYRRPAIVASPMADGETLQASGRSVPGFDLRAMLADVAALDDSLLSFGGHAAAVGLKLALPDLASFRQAATGLAAKLLGDTPAETLIVTDGSLAPELMTLATIDELDQLAPFGQHFATPCFQARMEIISQRFVGEQQNHLMLQLKAGNERLRAIWFRCQGHDLGFLENSKNVLACFELQRNRFRGQTSVQLLIKHLAPA
ncbi:MAG: single-stranded-DNA-specific exonuclease RecJ [Thermodesulfobacteriota bacterium]